MVQSGEVSEMWRVAQQTDLQFNMVTFVITCLVLSFAAATYVFTRSRPVYLLNFHCFKPPAK